MCGRALEGELLLRADCHVGHRSTRTASTLAGKVGARCIERTTIRVAIGWWSQEDHVAVDRAEESEGSSREDRFG